MGSEAMGKKPDGGERKFDREMFLNSPLFFEIKRILVAIVLSAAMAGFAYWLYGLTLPEGLPWGVDPRRPDSWKLAAVATGLLAAVVNRYLGWRVGLSAALIWMLLPFVWNEAILGTQASVTTSYSVAGLWVANAVFLWVTRKARRAQFDDEEPTNDETEMCGFEGWRKWVNGIVAWSVLGVSCLFAIALLWWHDYKIGEPASAYARGIVEMAGDRVIVLNGICDEQVEFEAKNRSGAEPGEGLAAISLTKDDEYRGEVAAWARREWPEGTNLWVAAQVGVEPLLELAVKAHPERFFVMNGGMESYEQWEQRWAAFAPYLKSSDPFVRVARRAFAYEGNAIANTMRDSTNGLRGAWQLYKRVCTEIEYGNVAALINMSEMIRRGFVVTERDKKYVRERVNAFLASEHNRLHAGEIVRSAGPVKSDRELLARMSEWAKERLANREPQRHELTEEEKMLIEQNNAMIRAVNRGDWVSAGYLARKILSGPRWQGYVAANAVMGDISAMSGDYVTGEAFYRIATSSTNGTPIAVWNNFADTLLRLGKLDEAESILRQSIAHTDETVWFSRVTLAEVLTRKAEKLQPAVREAIRSEVRMLVDSALKHAPAKAIRHVRDAERSGVIMK